MRLSFSLVRCPPGDCGELGELARNANKVSVSSVAVVCGSWVTVESQVLFTAARRQHFAHNRRLEFNC
jgi:hypothetical protein